MYHLSTVAAETAPGLTIRIDLPLCEALTLKYGRVCMDVSRAEVFDVHEHVHVFNI